MSENGNGIPKVEAIWVALGIVIAAIAAALDATGRAAFFRAMRALIEQHESRERVVVFGAQRNHRRAMSSAIRSGVAWLNRVIVELDDGRGP